jgi:hypothetical protein
MFDTLANQGPRDQDFPARTEILDTLTKVLNGQMYDQLPYEFHDERGAGGEYIPLRLRKPSVRYPLCRLVVEDSVSLLFSEGHFPSIDCSDPNLHDEIDAIIRASRLNIVMTEAAIRGSIGSVAIMLRIANGRPLFQVIDTGYLVPTWSPDEPDVLTAVTERYKVSGRQLRQSGYDVPDPAIDYWFQRVWDADAETWYQPQGIATSLPPVVDVDRTVRHGLGFVPIVWIRNLPGFSSTGDKIDGACTFRAAIETQIEIDYQLS